MVNKELAQFFERDLEYISKLNRDSFGPASEEDIDELFRIMRDGIKRQIFKELIDYSQSTNNSRVIEIIGNAIYHIDKDGKAK